MVIVITLVKALSEISIFFSYLIAIFEKIYIVMIDLVPSLFAFQGQVKQVTKDPCIGKEYSADPKNCNVFFQCSGGKMVKLPCPPGLHWNQQEKMCDWPHKVNRPECPASGEIVT